MGRGFGGSAPASRTLKAPKRATRSDVLRRARSSSSDASLSLTIRSCAAVEAAITAGSLDSRPGNPDRADKAGELNLREARRTHLAQEPRPFRRRADESDIAEALDPQRLGDDFEIKRVRMREHDDERAVGRAREFGRRFRRMNERDVRGRVRREKRRAWDQSTAPRKAAARARAPTPVRRDRRRTDRLRAPARRAVRSSARP